MATCEALEGRFGWVGKSASETDNGENCQLETRFEWVEAKEQRPHQGRGPARLQNWHLRLLPGLPMQFPGATNVHPVQVAGPEVQGAKSIPRESRGGKRWS